MYFLIVSLIGYLFGCLHGSQLVSKFKKIDIKNSGVKNSGASNTTILLGWKYGVLVALIDIFKATLAIMLVLYILNQYGITGEEKNLLVYLTALFVIIGHNYPITMKFSGGKGTASLVGVLLAIDWKIAVIGIGILFIFTFATDYLVVGVLFMYLSFLVTTYFFFGIEPTMIVLLLSVLSVMKHMENYKRILTKEETKLSSMFGK
ncbi:glycerol-3-phosphate acyltransferase 1 [Virgibacillus profundi]|uniref:Glycerol-3-phosphate acyltransferase n=1 Tax=Virgibacillus profundi TaxID=2024555 RepID=A0A2A2IHP4_9BACI|nr:glycerol-3-phosphate acyltransferase [Virgibacillus profundi]PAV30623.1 glycerol-3-phosphate acyltransferase 1 [Virgibacillus profundi]PXY54795.1 glycerol-3-phosphate acyltransferase [Virgibacillus profundi]